MHLVITFKNDFTFFGNKISIKDNKRCFRTPVASIVFITLLFTCLLHQARGAESVVQFDTDVLDVQDRAHIDLSQFSKAGYIMPGTYSLTIQVNKSSLSERAISFIAPDNDPKGSEACLTKDTVSQLGLTESASKNLVWWHHGQCLDPSSLKGMTMNGDLGAGALYVNIPVAFLEYSSEQWDPPSRWDDGVPGLLMDYSVDAQVVRQQSGTSSHSVSGTGVAGANVGAWRLRADWQANSDSGDQDSVHQIKTTWDRYYIYRAIKSLRAKLSLGENYLPSGMFDSFRFTGASLISDDSQLPPNLRGYAPEVTGVAKTNAKVTISQGGRVIYETTVAAGPFRIQDLSSATTGKLDVRVQEQDGSVQTFQVNTADIPYLTRPGMVRYKLAAGKPSNAQHHRVEGQFFSSGEFSWGISNGWSLFGGLLASSGYRSLAIGVGRDLLALGALSLDMTQSYARLADGTKQGGSWRLSYSKRFDETGSQVTFAGYRFSERDFMTMSQFIDALRNSGGSGAIGGGKEMYTLAFSQQIPALNMNAYLTYSHQTYWNRPATSSYNASVSHPFDIGQFKNVDVSLSAFRTQTNGKNDNGIYLGVSVPWGENGTLSYDSQYGSEGSSHAIGYTGRINSNNTYSLRGGSDQSGRANGSGYLSHKGDLTEMNATASYQDGQSSSLGMSLRGGVTATPYGMALHRIGSEGGTRLMVDTGGVSDVPVRDSDGDTYTNIFGKAVVNDVSSYWRTDAEVDLDKVSDDVDVSRSVVEGTLTEGAIGYRKFGVIAGKKAMATLKLADGSTPPFGAIVQNNVQAQTGLVGDDGSVWLSGIRPGSVMAVSWNGTEQCHISLPSPLPANLGDHPLMLRCLTHRESEQKTGQE